MSRHYVRKLGGALLSDEVRVVGNVFPIEWLTRQFAGPFAIEGVHLLDILHKAISN